MTTATQTLAVPSIGPSAAPQPRLLTAPVLRLFGANLAAMSSFYLLLSVVPLYCVDRGIGTAGAGLSIAVLMLASVAAEVVTPAVAARMGYRRLLMCGLVLLGVPALALPAVSAMTGVIMVSVVRGVGFAIVVVAIPAMVTTVIPAERRGEGLGLMGVVSTVPAVLMLPLGIWLVEVVGYPVVFASGAGVAVLSVPLVARLPKGRSETEEHGSLLNCLRRPGVSRPTLVFAATAVAGGVVVAFLPSAVTASVAIAALSAQNLAASLARWLAGRHSDRHGPTGLLVPAVVLSSVGMGVAAFTSSPAMVLVGMVVFGAGFGLAQTATFNTMLQWAAPSEYGAVSAAWAVAYDLGWGSGALVGGLVVASAGYPVAFAATAVVVLAALPVAFRARR